MKKPKPQVAILYGSTTGDTERIAVRISEILGTLAVASDLFDVAFTELRTLKAYKLYLLGSSTWYYGELQSDWAEQVPHLSTLVPWNGRYVATFGCGDQEDYPEHFCDALGEFYKLLQGSKVRWIGKVKSEGYTFKRSRALVEEGTFIGLPLDPQRQPEKTEARLQAWCKQLLEEWPGRS